MDTTFDDATALAAAIRNSELSPRELLEQYLGRVEALNPAINAVVTLDADRARAAAPRPKGRRRARSGPGRSTGCR